MRGSRAGRVNKARDGSPVKLAAYDCPELTRRKLLKILSGAALTLAGCGGSGGGSGNGGSNPTVKGNVLLPKGLTNQGLTVTTSLGTFQVSASGAFQIVLMDGGP